MQDIEVYARAGDMPGATLAALTAALEELRLVEWAHRAATCIDSTGEAKQVFKVVMNQLEGRLQELRESVMRAGLLKIDPDGCVVVDCAHEADVALLGGSWVSDDVFEQWEATRNEYGALLEAWRGPESASSSQGAL